MYLEPSALVTGGAIALLRVVEALDKDAFMPLVVLGSEGPLVEAFRRIPGCDVLCRPLPAAVSRVTRFGAVGGGFANVGSIIAYGLMLRRIADRWKADIVHSNGLKTHVLSALMVRRRRRILIWHIRDLLSAAYMPARNATWMRWLARVIPDVTICISACTRAALTGTAGTRWPAVHTVYDGVRCDAQRAEDARDDTRHRVLMLGRIAEWKGQHVFVRAAQRLCADDQETQFLIVGGATNDADAEYERRLRASVATAELSGRIAFAGVVRDVSALLHGADLLVHCSTSPEPFGLVVIEAMAAAVPVVAANLGGPAEVIRDGANGRLYPAGDDGALATILEELLADGVERRRLGMAGRRMVEERFDIRQTAGQVAAIYRQYACGAEA